MEALLEVQHMTKFYGSRSSLTKAVNDISFFVEKGEFTAVMGASGSGKTTLLNCISTIDRVTSGHILVEGQDITRLRGKNLMKFRREKIGFIFQEFHLLDTLNAFDNIALALQIQNVRPEKIRCQVKEIAEKLNITEVLKKYPYEMSGGQKQRCACARALITNPSFILADEPTGALDSQSAGMLLGSMQYMNQDLGATILMVTHDAFSASYGRRVLFLKDGKLFHELRRGKESRHEFFNQIIHVISLLGGDLNHVV
ncbi:MAG TPA: ABC transporter ATP-binding protein [Candidatus Blautia pullicola]|jgi:putative ABC transport system ATP-binding protein|uniref:ABC transporter ATP-binding protein n=1 Tax=Candidatus Blautia pullicola TaxID=2838498 RepID=A0A9D2FPB0_9FIRM|nr:ABC transporter ATP-binding protein [Candidatus Blautia pullicola]